ncbi:hypothetical protein L207DRAFT_631162 [Hyaloscypha variabilis F]|uniref:Smr domain-containing protein n=1 Tax=Hyaloscypha variabilis (strain UAMH 11265 / GT02V1 / F) TaxID=1149755 RepID=A0A2J6RWU4_HYAVF|nr:hypothetical protein L207DRAFT_631162 [Hyaloscypha variabilis F]
MTDGDDGPAFGDFRRGQDLCDLGAKWGIEGFVSMPRDLDPMDLNDDFFGALGDVVAAEDLREMTAAQAWNRNDARAAKALSLRGQSENDAMRKSHREAARELYEERNKNSSSSSELYVDLHGPYLEEAVEYLEKVLLENQKKTRPVYAITGTSHHSKNSKDKVDKAIRNFLNILNE